MSGQGRSGSGPSELTCPSCKVCTYEVFICSGDIKYNEKLHLYLRWNNIFTVFSHKRLILSQEKESIDTKKIVYLSGYSGSIDGVFDKLDPEGLTVFVRSGVEFPEPNWTSLFFESTSCGSL